MGISNRRGAVAAATMCALVISGCGNASTVSTPSEENPEKFILTLKNSSGSRYEVVASPEELAERADLVIRGHILDARIGPSEKTAEKDFAPHGLLDSWVLQVRVVEVLRGRPATLTKGHVFVTIPRADIPEEKLDSTLPVAEALVFLDDLEDAKRPYGYENPDAGRPPDARLFAPYPQGFIFKAPDGSPLGVEDLGEMPEEWSTIHSYDSLVERLRT